MPSLRQLGESHRVAQTRLGIETVSLVVAAWPLLDLDDIDGSASRWLSVVAPAVQAQRGRSSQLAGAYLRAYRLLDLDEPFEPVIAEDAPHEQVVTSLLVTGVYGLFSNLGRGVTPDRAADIAKAASAGAAMRLALNGGRETITETIKADPRARGYERVTSGAACDFCEMLADRGAVYSEEAADFEAHDHCSCSAVPVYG